MKRVDLGRARASNVPRLKAPVNPATIVRELSEWLGQGESPFVVLSGATFAAGGGAQRTTAIARELARRGHRVVFHNNSLLQPSRLDEGVWQVGPDAWRAVRDVLRDRPGVAIAAMPVYLGDLRVLKSAGWFTVYDCIDDWAAFVAAGAINAHFVAGELEIAQLADMATASAPQLADVLIGLGVETPVVILNAGPNEPVPNRRVNSDRLRVVYCGSIDNPWLDWSALATLANVPGVEVVMVGKAPDTLPGNAARWRNFRWLGERPYPEALQIMATCDVGLVPFKGKIAHAVDPIKQHDYRACGLWTAATDDVHPLRQRRYCVTGKAKDFLDVVRRAGKWQAFDPVDPATVATHSWSFAVDRLLYAVSERRGQRQRVAIVVPQRATPEARFVDYCDYKVRVAWACTARCNANPVCPYCCTEPMRARHGEAFFTDPRAIVDGFLNMTDRIGPYYLMSGWGDGMADDEVASMLGTIARFNRVDVTTNLRFPKRRLKLLPTNGNVNLCTSFHPHLWRKGGVDAFLDKLNWARDEGFPVAVVGVVGWPEYMGELARWVDAIRAAGYVANALPYMGWYPTTGDGSRKSYPRSYTSEEWDVLRPRSCEATAATIHKGFAEQTQSPRGLTCWTGVKYIYVDWDGSIRRCVGYHDNEDGSLGDLFSGVRLWDAPRPCGADLCTCSDLWQYVELDTSKQDG